MISFWVSSIRFCKQKSKKTWFFPIQVLKTLTHTFFPWDHSIYKTIENILQKQTEIFTNVLLILKIVIEIYFGFELIRTELLRLFVIKSWRALINLCIGMCCILRKILLFHFILYFNLFWFLLSMCLTGMRNLRILL